MKRAIIVILSLLFSCVCFSQGEQFQKNNFTFEVIGDDKLAVVSYNSQTSVVSIPSTIFYEGMSYTVTSIKGGAFLNNDYLKAVDIPGTITTIGTDSDNYGAFEECDSLQSISLPNSVIRIGSYTFYSCDALSEVLLGNVNSIGRQAFQYCNNLVEIDIPNSVDNVGKKAFSGCNMLSTVRLPQTCIFAVDAFENSGKIIIDNDITYVGKDTLNVGSYKFAYAGLMTFNLNGSLYTSSELSVKKCPESKSGAIIIPASLNIGGDLFPVTTIAPEAFVNCEAITSVSIPNTITSIANDAFAFCLGLNSVFLPQNAIIASNAFEGAGAKTFDDIVYGGSDSLIIGNYVLTYPGFTTFYLNGIPYNSANELSVVKCPVSKSGALSIPSHLPINGSLYPVTSIRGKSFHKCVNLTSITIPNTIITIGDLLDEYGAFEECDNLTSITIPSGVVNLGRYSFYSCDNLNTIVIPNSVLAIGEHAFEKCPSLTEVTLPVNATIPSNSFSNLGVSIDGVKYSGNKILNIGNYSFECPGFITFKIDGVEYNVTEASVIECDKSKSGCVSILDSVMNSPVTFIRGEAFYDCDNISSIIVPNTVTTIGKLNDGYGAFEECSNLISITLPSSIDSLGKYTFWKCGRLETITCLAETAPSVGGSAFTHTPNTKNLIVPFGANGYSANWGDATWQKIYYKINPGETKTLASTFTIEGNKVVINQGVLRLAQGGELINQTTTNVGGIVEVEAINRENNWNYIGAPFNNYVLGVILPQENDVSVSTFNHNTGNWNTNWATNETEIPTGEGFAAWNFASSPIIFTTYGDVYDYAGDSVGEYEFENTPDFSLFNEEQITITHSDNNNTDNVNWLSVANPYTFKLDVEKIINQNSLQGNVLYKYNGTTFIPVSSGEIQVTEGFFVNNQSITLKKAQQHTLSAKTKMQKDYIRLAVNDGENEIELQFAHNEDAKQDYDIFDANKLFSPLEITEPYFVTNGVALVKEEVKEYPYTATLNIRNYETKEVTLSIDNIPEGVNVYLIDNGFEVKMNDGVEYNTRIIKGENADRFKVLFKKQHRLESIKDNQINISNNNRHISVKSDISDLHIEVYNQLGQKIFSTNEYNFTLSEQPAGSYVIKAYQGREIKTQKIIIN